MKNLKKVLSLVLALAMALSLMTAAFAADASDYKDYSKVTYKEAVDVMTAAGIFNGGDGNNFNPDATLNREQAAKIITYMLVGQEKADKLTATVAPYADVAANRWSAGAIAYCTNEGILAGDGNGRFNPTAPVLGTQFAKMLLVALGYDPKIEQLVGNSWAINTAKLALNTDLDEDMEDISLSKELTREEAAQILLNALNAETVEYAQEAKSADFKPTTNADGAWVFKGKLYLTVAGAVKTGNKLYKDFDLKKEDSTDAFYRPYTKWTKDNVSVEIMKAPKATFTKKFSACDLLVALGVKESDTKTKIFIDKVYCDGDDTVDFDDYDIYDDAYTNADGKAYWKHGHSNCPEAKGAKHGAQGTLTQVFYNGKDADGNKHYTITSIETWLGKVTKVTNKTTARDNHVKSDGAVKLNAYFNNLQKLEENNYDYCGKMDEAGHTGHCAALENANDDGVTELTFNDPTGLKKDDYVLFTYSFRTLDDDGDKTDDYECVQTVDVTEGKNGRLSGYKFGTSAGSDPSETRIDSEYVKDSQHFHMGYDLSKTNQYGTYTFFYDAYGNVIGMKDAADSSNWAVIDRAWVTFENKGTAVMNADVVSVDDAKTTTSTVKKFTDITDYIEAIEESINDSSAKNFAYDLAVYLKDLTNGEGYKDFDPIYDHLFKVSTDKDGVFSVKVAKNSDGEYVVNEYGDLESTDDTIKTVKGKPYLEIKEGDMDADKSISLTSDTKFLVHNMDGTYSAYTGYKNVPSLIAHYAEVVFDSDYADKFVAEVVYLTKDVYTTDSKVVAYVGNGADRSNIEVVEDGDTYYNLTAYVNGEETNVYVDEADMKAYFDKKADSFVAGFYELQYTEIDGVKTAKVTKNFTASTDDDDNYLVEPVVAEYFNGTVIKIDGTTYALTDDCGLFAINGKKVEKSSASEIEDLYDDFDSFDDSDPDNENAHKVYVALNDKDEATAIYIKLAVND
mgnify:CR=1 FL=1